MSSFCRAPPSWKCEAVMVAASSSKMMRSI